ncbi:hypothetical protein NL676_022652 [Syzygium grande]|nr:hypothetical protein NL676_022652 [Syzygium grande]
MSALVVMWENELGKLREKVLFGKLVLHKSKHEDEVANKGGEVEDKKDKAEGKGIQTENALSEDTLFAYGSFYTLLTIVQMFSPV